MGWHVFEGDYADVSGYNWVVIMWVKFLVPNLLIFINFENVYT